MTSDVTARPAAGPYDLPDLLTSADITFEAGITYRQCDYWVRRGFLRPEHPAEGSGVRRVWPLAELDVARKMGSLVKIGFPLETAHDLARAGSARTQVAPGIWLEFGPAHSGECAADDHGACFPDEPSDCGCPCHEGER